MFKILKNFYYLKNSIKQQFNKKLLKLVKENFESVSIETKDQEKNFERLSHEAYKIRKSLLDLDFTLLEIKKIVFSANSLQSILDLIQLLPKANVLKLKHFNKKNILLTFEKNWSIRILFEIAQLFQQHNLDEDTSFANFNSLLSSTVTDSEVKEIVKVLVQAKYKDLPIKQNDIIKFVSSIKKEKIEDPIKNLYLGLVIIKEKNLDLNFSDLLVAAISGRPPKNVALTYVKIRDNDLAIRKDEYITLNLKQSIIDKIVNLMFIGKKYNLIIDFEDIVKQFLLGNNVLEVLHIVVKLREKGFNNVEFNYITKLSLGGVDLNTVIPAFVYAEKRLDIKEFMKDIERGLTLRKNGTSTQFNLINFAKALDLGVNEFSIDKETLILDFASNVKVWEILDFMNYSKKHNVEVNYSTAKALAKVDFDNFKNIIYKSLNPFEIESPNFYVTTKDNIEIKVKLIIFVVYNIKNIFKGTDEEYLLRRVKAIFIDEIQKNYNHDEIVKNIEIISRNILLRLKGDNPIGKEKDQLHKVDKEIIREHELEGQFMEVSKFIPIKVLIPHIEFVKDTFKEIEKLKQKYETEKEKLKLELDKLRAEVKIQEAWAKSGDLKYLILKDDDSKSHNPHHHNFDKEKDE